MTIPTLRTDRLTLRPPRQGDARVITKALNNFAISRWLTVVPFPYGITDAEWFISECVRGHFHAWLIWHDDRFIGTIGLDNGLGYWLAEDAWGQGYATEAAAAVIADHFATTDANSITSSYFDGNDASRNVLTKMGFLDTGPKQQHSHARGEDVAGRQVKLTRAHWQARHDA